MFKKFFENESSSSTEFDCFYDWCYYIEITLCYYIFRTATERQLKAAREEIETLRTRLREAMKISEEQKQHFRANIEELKSQLHDAISKRDSVLAQKYVLIPILCQNLRSYQMLSRF